jgi:hypothetical protein
MTAFLYRCPTTGHNVQGFVPNRIQPGRFVRRFSSPKAAGSTPGVHVVRLAWGRMAYIGIYPDTVGVVTTLQRLSRAGVAEATAEKIEG